MVSQDTSYYKSTPPSTFTPGMRPSRNSFAMSSSGIHSMPSCLLMYAMILRRHHQHIPIKQTTHSATSPLTVRASR